MSRHRSLRRGRDRGYHSDGEDFDTYSPFYFNLQHQSLGPFYRGQMQDRSFPIVPGYDLSRDSSGARQLPGPVRGYTDTAYASQQHALYPRTQPNASTQRNGTSDTRPRIPHAATYSDGRSGSASRKIMGMNIPRSAYEFEDLDDVKQRTVNMHQDSKLKHERSQQHQSFTLKSKHAKAREDEDGLSSFSKLKTSIMNLMPVKKPLALTKNMRKVDKADTGGGKAREINVRNDSTTFDGEDTYRCPTANVAGWIGNNNRTVIDGLADPKVVDANNRKRAREKQKHK